MLFHIVRPGDTLFSVARTYGVPLRNLTFDNGILDPTRLPVGLCLIVREPTAVYTVRPGDTLFSIARATDIPLLTLWQNNLFLQGGAAIYPGDVLFLGTKGEHRPGFTVGGYVYPFTESSWLDTVLPLQNVIIPFTYGFRQDGSLISPDDRKILNAASYYGTRTFLHLSTLTENDTFSTALAEDLLASPAMQSALANSILKTLQSKRQSGVDVDFEYLGARNASAYAAFLAFLKDFLAPYGYPVYAALAPKTRDDQPGLLYEGHDYAAVGSAVDAVLLMTYEWGYTYGPPQAVSPITPVTNVLKYALTRIPADKILLGISDYGYDFTLPYVQGLSKARSLSIRDAVLLAGQTGSVIRYDDTAASPYFEYKENGVSHIVWFEDPRSLSARLSLLPEYGLKGMLCWTYTRPDPALLALLATLA